MYARYEYNWYEYEWNEQEMYTNCNKCQLQQLLFTQIYYSQWWVSIDIANIEYNSFTLTDGGKGKGTWRQ